MPQAAAICQLPEILYNRLVRTTARLMGTPRRHQFTLRTILLIATVVPPLIGGFAGALGPSVHNSLRLAIGIPALALALLGLTFVLTYIVFVLPMVALFPEPHDSDSDSDE